MKEINHFGRNVKEKGEFGGECARTKCSTANADYFNSSTRQFYCEACANEINKWSQHDEKIILCKKHIQAKCSECCFGCAKCGDGWTHVELPAPSDQPQIGDRLQCLRDGQWGGDRAITFADFVVYCTVLVKEVPSQYRIVGPDGTVKQVS